MTLLKANQRFFDVQHESQATLLPIEGYEDMPLLSLKMSVENLETVVPKVVHNAQIATGRSAFPVYGLTQDQSAAIYLYTMNWKPNDRSVCARLNDALRSKDQFEPLPYFFYLKLFLSGLWKLKSVKKTVWRGVRGDLSSEYPRGKRFIWCGFSSCVGSFDEIQAEKFVGRTGTRTVFQIECETGKSINAHSYDHNIDEVLLLPGTQLQVVDRSHSPDALCVIRLKEVKSSFAFLESPLSSSSTANISTERTQQKIHSVPASPSTLGTTKTGGVPRKQSSCASLSSHVPKIGIEVVKKQAKSYQNKLLKELIHDKQKEESIRFSKQFFNYDDMHIIVDELTSNKSWTAMYLWQNCMNDRHLTILLRGLEMNYTVICLGLDHNLLGDDGASILASALKSNTCLRSIYLNDNHIGDEGVEELSVMLSINRTLINLELSSNDITDRGVAAISNTLKLNRHLRTLSLNNNKITGIGAQYLGAMLQVNSTLSDLQLSSNAISDDGVIDIVQALEHNNTLESLHIGQTMIGEDSMQNIGAMLKVNDMLKCLYVNNNHLGDDALLKMIPALTQNTTLTTLDLSMNDLTVKSVDKLARLFNQTSLTTLSISDNPLGDCGITSISSALIENKSVVKLMIESVEMTSEGVTELSTMLRSNTKLRSVALDNNQIAENGMKILVDGMKYNRSVEYLYLNNCGVTDECVPLIVDMMKHSTTLMSIELVKNRLTEHAKLVLNEASRLNKTYAIYLDFTFH